MEVFTLVIQTAVGSLLSIFKIALLLIPILILIELARNYKFIEKITGQTKKILNFLTLPQEAAFPLLAGMFFGIIFGSALIIDYAREGYLKKRDLMLIGIFLSISHSVVEDTFIFAVFGANTIVVLLVRTILAVLITKGAAALLDRLSESIS